jgi:NADH-quinone oxidoreductase subunit M
MILVGAFTKYKVIAACAIPGAVLAAAYMLRMLQKVVWGGVNNPDHTGIMDLNMREIVTLAPLLVFVFWIGLSPGPFIKVMHTSVSHLIAQVSTAVEMPITMAEMFLP